MNEKTVPVSTQTDWSDFGQRVLGAAIAGATAAAATLQFHVGFSVEDALHWLTVIGVGALTGALTSVKGLIGQGRGSNPADSKLK